VRALVAAVVLLGACAELPAIEGSVCGNGVVEPGIGEECDSTTGCGAGDSTNACRFVCDATGAGCPTGYQCGLADGRCRLPTETFALTGVQPMATQSVSSIDMDGDGATDLMGFDSRGLMIRFGDGIGALAATTRLNLPLSSTAAAAPDVDLDGDRDLAAPFAGIGYALFLGDGARGLTPAAQAAVHFPGDVAACPEIIADDIKTNPDAEANIVIVNGGKEIAFLDDDACAGAPPGDCTISDTGGALVGGRLTHAVTGYGLLSGVLPGEQLSGAVVGDTTISIWGQSSTALRPKRIDTWTLSQPIGEGGRVELADLDGDGCSDLVVDTGAAIEVVHSFVLGSACAGLDPSGTAATAYASPGGPVVGIGDVDADGVVELLYLAPVPDGFQGSIVAAARLVGAGWQIVGVLVSVEQPREIVVLDYNHDGIRDLAMTLHGTDTVDFYLNHGGGEGFARFPVSLGGAPETLDIGDFDGDLHEDVVVSVSDPTNPQGLDTVYLLWGDASGRPGAPQLAGQFLSDARPTSVLGNPLQDVESVLVVSNHPTDEACDRTLAILIGDTSRQLASPYVLLYQMPSGDLESVIPLSVVDATDPSTGTPRLVSFGAIPPAAAAGQETLVVSVLGFDGYAFTATDQFALPAGVVTADELAFAQWRSGDLDADGSLDIVGLSGARAVVADLDSREPAIVELPPELQYAPWFDLVDMDGDGDLDAVGAGGAAIVGNPDEPVAAASRFWIATNNGGVLELETAAVLDVPADLFCFDADVIVTTADGAPQLAGLCYSQTADDFGPRLLLAGAGASGLESPRLLRLGVDAAAIEVDDFTGDGLDDVAVLGGASVSLFTQCHGDTLLFGECLAAEAL
jgi:hypothetical protein